MIKGLEIKLDQSLAQEHLKTYMCQRIPRLYRGTIYDKQNLVGLSVG